MSLDGSEAFFYSSLTNTQGVDSQYVDLGGVNGVLKGVNDQIQGGATTDDLPEGKVNLYFTDGRAQGAFTAGTGIVIATGTISNTGVLSLTGTNNRISVSGSTGNITLNLPQDINTTSSPSFTGLTLGTLSGVLKASAGVVANGATTDDLTEGKTNLYFTNNRARASITASAPIFAISGIISLGYNTSNLKLTGSNLDTIQDIATSSSPRFARLLDSSIGTSSNQLIGSGAGGSLTTGGGNTLIGSGAGNAITTGTLNIGIGAGSFGGSGLMTQNSAYNVGVGVNALYSCATTANNNVAVGPNALINLTTGTYNTQIGNGGSNVLTTGSYNIHIGQNTTSSSTSVSNEGVINLTSATTTGRGANTMLINATSGLYSYSPGYWWGYGSNISGGIINWTGFGATFRNIQLNPVDNTQLILPFNGLYELTISGSVYVGLVSQGIDMYVNGNKYLALPIFYDTITGWTSASLTAFVMVVIPNTYVQYTATAGIGISSSHPLIYTAKFISL